MFDSTSAASRFKGTLPVHQKRQCSISLSGMQSVQHGANAACGQGVVERPRATQIRNGRRLRRTRLGQSPCWHRGLRLRIGVRHLEGHLLGLRKRGLWPPVLAPPPSPQTDPPTYPWQMNEHACARGCVQCWCPGWSGSWSVSLLATVTWFFRIERACEVPRAPDFKIAGVDGLARSRGAEPSRGSNPVSGSASRPSSVGR